MMTQTVLQHPFTKQEYMQRVDRFRSKMAEQDVDLAIITSPENIYYLSGYMTRAITAPQILVVPIAGAPLLTIRHRDVGNLFAIADYTPIDGHATYEDHEGSRSPVEVLLGLLGPYIPRTKRIGFEKQSIFLLVDYYEQIVRAFPNARAADITMPVEELRLRKSPAEIACHRKAGMIAVAGVRAGIEATRPGRTDAHVAAQTAAALIENGSEWISTWPVILTGNNTGRSHASWQNVPIVAGAPTTIETAGVVARYHSPLYVTVIDQPTPDQRSLASVLSEAQEAALAMMRPGVVTGEVFAAAERVISGAGLAELIHGRIGYTTGIGFPPNWVQRLGIDVVRNGTRVLEPGMVFHMVMTLKRQNQFGFGQSVPVLITESGHEALTGDFSAEPVLRS